MVMTIEQTIVDFLKDSYEVYVDHVSITPPFISHNILEIVLFQVNCVNLPRSIVLNHTRSLPSITRYRWASTFRERASLTDLKRLFRATTVAHTCIIVKLYSHHIPVIYHMHMHIYLYIYIYTYPFLHVIVY